MNKLIKYLKKQKNENFLLRTLWFKSLRFRRKRSLKLKDIEVINQQYNDAFGVYPDLKNPKTFYEKLNWLKLNYRNDLMPIVADKYKVHEYLRNKGYDKYLNEILGYWTDIKNFDTSELPTRFVLKATHASGDGWNLIVKNKSDVNWATFRLVMKEWLSQKIDWMGREWHYGGMTPGIICEKYLEDESGELRDYKIHCFNGKPEMIYVCTGRYTGKKKKYYYSTDWQFFNNTIESQAGLTVDQIPKPENLEKMLQLAAELSSPFPYVRVDFYNVNGKIYFGELTFFDFAGFKSSFTAEAQLELGQKLKLPEANI